jgi:hypothetical protein
MDIQYCTGAQVLPSRGMFEGMSRKDVPWGMDSHREARQEKTLATRS